MLMGHSIRHERKMSIDFIEIKIINNYHKQFNALKIDDLGEINSVKVQTTKTNSRSKMVKILPIPGDCLLLIANKKSWTSLPSQVLTSSGKPKI